MTKSGVFLFVLVFGFGFGFGFGFDFVLFCFREIRAKVSTEVGKEKVTQYKF